MRYRLRTLLILMSVVPPVLAGIWVTRQAWPLAIAIALVVIAFSIALGFVVAFSIRLLATESREEGAD